MRSGRRGEESWGLRYCSCRRGRKARLFRGSHLGGPVLIFSCYAGMGLGNVGRGGWCLVGGEGN